jgi:hypothetical protein
MSLKLNSSGGGSVTLQEPTTASNVTLNLPAADGTVVYENASGNVGIGTSSPVSKLHVAGGSESTIRNTASAGSSWFVGSNAASYILHNESNTPMVFTTNSTERARIDASGNLLVGVAALPSGNQRCFIYNPTDQVASIWHNTSNSGTWYLSFHYNGANTGRIERTGATTVAYTTSSDYRLKENVQPMTGALAKVAALKPCTYKWKSDGSDGQGFIAHELAEVCPDAVTGEKDAVNEDGSIKPQGIDTSFLVATLTAGLQEAVAMIEELKAKVAALEAQ